MDFGPAQTHPVFGLKVPVLSRWLSPAPPLPKLMCSWLNEHAEGAESAVFYSISLGWSRMLSQLACP